MIQKITDAYEEGQRAYRRGTRIIDNPYILHSTAAKSWTQGWVVAARADREERAQALTRTVA